ncbi:MAG: hypothetical protein ACTSPK_14750 [Candidatus Heimdallarchaeota archaeon]
MPRRYDAELLKTSKYREIEYMLMPTRTESTKTKERKRKKKQRSSIFF